jgi:hypothetical protein
VIDRRTVASMGRVGANADTTFAQQHINARSAIASAM